MGIHVLVVDDSSVMRKLVLKNLRQGGIELEEYREASNGKEALEELEEGEVDIVLTDWNMPEVDGLEFVMALRKKEQQEHTPVIMFSSEGEKGKVKKALQLGADNYIVKPIETEELTKKVEDTISGAKDS